jgi:hypothetical protein
VQCSAVQCSAVQTVQTKTGKFLGKRKIIEGRRDEKLVKVRKNAELLRYENWNNAYDEKNLCTQDPLYSNIKSWLIPPCTFSPVKYIAVLRFNCYSLVTCQIDINRTKTGLKSINIVTSFWRESLHLLFT